MGEIVLLLVVWFGFWGVYNFVLLPDKVSTERTPLLLSIIYFLVSILCLEVAKVDGLTVFVESIVFLIIMVMDLKKESRVYGRLSNSIFQVTWFYAAGYVMHFNVVYMALIFAIGHIPIYFVKHLNMLSKSIVMVLAVLGGILMAGIVSLFSGWILVGQTIAVLIHFYFYFLLRPIDSRYHLRIIN